MRARVPCKSYIVRPQPGHAIYSVLLMRARVACRIANMMELSSSALLEGFSSHKPSTRPSMRSTPKSAAAFIRKASTDCSSYALRMITGASTPSTVNLCTKARSSPTGFSWVVEATIAMFSSDLSFAIFSVVRSLYSSATNEPFTASLGEHTTTSAAMKSAAMSASATSPPNTTGTLFPPIMPHSFVARRTGSS